MINNCPNTFRTLRWATGVGLAGGAAVAAAMIGAANAPAAHADDLPTDIGLAASSGNQYDPAVFDYSPDPSHLFAPVYTIQPTGPEDVMVTSASSDVYGTQDFTVSSLGIPVGTFTGSVEYSPVSSPLDIFGNPYVEDINVAGTPGTLLPENTDFLITEFGGGYGNVLEESMNDAGTSATVGDFLLTPFGDENITRIVDLFLPPGVTDAVGSVSAAADSAISAAPTPDGEIAQTISALDQTTTILDAAPTTDLGTRSADLLTGGEALPGQIDPILTQFASLQDELNPTDQTLLGYVDELMVSSAQNLVSADQAFVAADQAGELSGNSVAPADLAVIGGALNFLDSFLTADGATIFADLTGGLDVSSVADLASSLDPSAAVDPSIFTDVLSSIGL